MEFYLSRLVILQKKSLIQEHEKLLKSLKESTEPNTIKNLKAVREKCNEIKETNQMAKAIRETITTIKQECRKNLEHPQDRKEFNYAKEAAILKKSTLSHVNKLSRNNVFSVSIAIYLRNLYYSLLSSFGFKKYATLFENTEQHIKFKKTLKKQLSDIKDPPRNHFMFSPAAF